MKPINVILAIFVLLGCAGSVGLGQGFFGYYPDDPTEIVHMLLGTNFAFSATAHIVWEGSFATVKTEARYSVLNQNVRTEFLISKNPGLGFDSSAMKKAQRCGLDQTIAIMRPDKRFFLCPKLQAWVDLTETNRPVIPDFKIRKMEIDQEKVDGHPCIEYDILASGGGRYITALVWEATDMKGFPIRIDCPYEGNGLSVVLSNVDFKAPLPEVFEIPPGSQRYTNMEDLVNSVCKEAAAEPGK